MPIGAIIATVGAVLGFVGIGLYVVIRGRKIRWPQGHHAEGTAGIEHRYRCRAIVPNDSRPVDLPRLARVGALCANTVTRVWEKHRPGTAPEVRQALKRTGVYLLPDAAYNDLDGPDAFMDGTNGTVTYAGRMIGSGIPLATARLDLLPGILDDGGVVLHELIHVANRAAGAGGNVWTDVRHEDPDVWGTIQGEARQQVRERLTADRVREHSG